MTGFFLHRWYTKYKRNFFAELCHVVNFEFTGGGGIVNIKLTTWQLVKETAKTIISDNSYKVSPATPGTIFIRLSYEINGFER